MTESAQLASPPPSGIRRWGVVYGRPLRTVVVALLAIFSSDQLIQTIESNGLRQAVVRQITPAATALTAALDERIAVLGGVSSFLSLDWGRPTLKQDFNRFTERLLRDQHGIRTAQYLIHGVIEQTWPIPGNEGAVGHDVLSDSRPGAGDDVRRAMTERGVILSGPIVLAQGGTGLIARSGVRVPTDSVVAVAAVVIDRAKLITAAGLDVVPGLRVTVIDESGTWIGGEHDLGKDIPPEPIAAAVNVANRHWQIQAVPDIGWHAMVARMALGTRFGFGAAFLMIGVVTLIYGSRNRAIAEVEQQRAKQRGEEKFVKLFAITPDGVVLTRYADGEILEVNPRFCEISKRRREQLVGRKTVDLRLWPSGTDRALFIQRLDEEGSLSDYAMALTLPDGSLRETRISGRVFDLDGERCVINIVRDVHEQRILERRLEAAARLESVGRLAGGVAHDFNNLITGISGYSEMLLLHLKDDPEALADLTEIVRAANRAASLTKQLLAFARRQMVQPRVVDLNDLVLDSNALIRKLINDRIILSTSLSPEPARILIDPVQGDQLLTNLTINAREAMPNGGTLKFQVMTHDEVVTLLVIDSGMGIPMDVIPYVFEPFYTTKGVNRGSGLGLATCQAIMMQAGGGIEVSSLPDQGAVFTLTFPKVAADLVVQPADLPRPDTRRSLTALSGETVLVVEDEIQIRRLCERLLREWGYNVLTSENGVEAMATSAAYPGSIDLLLTDMVMPFMGGGELRRKFAAARPTTKVLLMSGYSEELIAAEHDDVPFLAKPFTPTELGEAVREVLKPESE